MPYRIQSGDTLNAIAQRFGTSVDAIVHANPSITNPNLIHAGQSLAIPGEGDAFVGAGVPDQDLQQGSTGPQVEQLQAALVKLGYLSQDAVATGPGTFGPRTAAALRAFQTDHGVPATAYFGPMTREALSRALGAGAPSAPPPVVPSAPPARPAASGAGVPGVDLQRGMQGAEVQRLQSSLVQLGYLSQERMNTGPGIFGPATEAALRTFQADWAVPTTGYYGSMTREALSRALAGAKPVEAPTPPTSGDFRQRALSAAQGEVGRWDMHRYLNGNGPEAWCNDFVSWCYRQAGQPIGPSDWYRYVPYMQRDLQRQGDWIGRWGTPSPGDIVCFDWDGDAVPDHTGIVESINGDGSINTIEGNVNGSNSWNGQLARCRRTRDVITGFGHLG